MFAINKKLISIILLKIGHTNFICTHLKTSLRCIYETNFIKICPAEKKSKMGLTKIVI